MRLVIAPGQRSFTRVPNATLQDERLSFRARGLLAHLLSHEDGGDGTADSIAATSPEGRDAIRGAMRELEEAGFVTRLRARDERGRLHAELVVRDVPEAAR